MKTSKSKTRSKRRELGLKGKREEVLARCIKRKQYINSISGKIKTAIINSAKPLPNEGIGGIMQGLIAQQVGINGELKSELRHGRISQQEYNHLKQVTDGNADIEFDRLNRLYKKKK